MDRNKVARRDGKTHSAFNVVERHTFIHEEYHMVPGGAGIGPTGLLIIAGLEPKNTMACTLPGFVFR